MKLNLLAVVLAIVLACLMPAGVSAHAPTRAQRYHARRQERIHYRETHHGASLPRATLPATDFASYEEPERVEVVDGIKYEHAEWRFENTAGEAWSVATCPEGTDVEAAFPQLTPGAMIGMKVKLSYHDSIAEASILGGTVAPQAKGIYPAGAIGIQLKVTCVESLTAALFPVTEHVHEEGQPNMVECWNAPSGKRECRKV